MAERLTRITSRITDSPGGPRNASAGVAGVDVVVGLFTQTTKPGYVFASDRTSMAVWEQLDGEGFGLAMTFPAGAVREMKSAPYDGEPKGFAHALAFLRTDAKGEVSYASGYAWAKAGEIKLLPEWRAYLETFARTMK